MARPTRRTAVRLVEVRKVEVITVPVVGGRSILKPEDAVSVLQALILEKDREHFVVLHLSTRHRVVSVEIATVGTLSASLVHPREVFKGAFLANAGGIICGHNHPSGDPSPSPEDLALYDRLKKSGELLGVPLLDFIIVAESGSWSALSTDR